MSHLVVRAGGFSLRLSLRLLTLNLVLGVLLAGSAGLAVTLGTSSVEMPELVEVLLGRGEAAAQMVVLQWRMPRVLAAVLFGAALGISGAIFQSLTRNPLGSPDIIGFNSGAFTGVVAALLLGASGYLGLTVGAVLGGLATAALVYLISFRRGVTGFRFIIVGIAVGAFLSSLNSWFSVRADVDLALRAAVWGAGSLGLADWTTLAVAAGLFAVVLLMLPAAQRWLDCLELGDDAAAALGMRVETAKAVLIVLGTVTTALVTASAGPIAFVALAAPHIARRLIRAGTSADLCSSAVVGALLLLLCDMAAQHVVAGVSLPVGAVTVCVGGAYLIFLLIVESRRQSL